MNKVYIVIKNGEVFEVFDNEEAALNCKKNLGHQWSLVRIIEKEVKML